MRSYNIETLGHSLRMHIGWDMQYAMRVSQFNAVHCLFLVCLAPRIEGMLFEVRDGGGHQQPQGTSSQLWYF